MNIDRACWKIIAFHANNEFSISDLFIYNSDRIDSGGSIPDICALVTVGLNRLLKSECDNPFEESLNERIGRERSKRGTSCSRKYTRVPRIRIPVPCYKLCVSLRLHDPPYIFNLDMIIDLKLYSSVV